MVRDLSAIAGFGAIKTWVGKEVQRKREKDRTTLEVWHIYAHAKREYKDEWKRWWVLILPPGFCLSFFPSPASPEHIYIWIFIRHSSGLSVFKHFVVVYLVRTFACPRTVNVARPYSVRAELQQALIRGSSNFGWQTIEVTNPLAYTTRSQPLSIKTRFRWNTKRGGGKKNMTVYVRLCKSFQHRSVSHIFTHPLQS